AFCVTGLVTVKLLFGGRVPESRWRCTLGAVLSVGNNVEIWIAADARACSKWARATFSVWLSASACFSSAFKSSSLKTDHHSPLGNASFGALSRHGSATSHFAGVTAAGRL